MAKKAIAVEEKLKFSSSESIPDGTERGSYEAYTFHDKENNLIEFHAPNKVTKHHLIKGHSYLIKYTKIPTTKNHFRGFRPLSIK